MMKDFVWNNPLALVVVVVPLEDVHTKHNNLDVEDKDTLDDHEVDGVEEA